MKKIEYDDKCHEAYDFLGNYWKYECYGCSMANKEMIPLGGIIKETNTFLLYQDSIYPIEGFLIINSKKHINSITDLSEEERHELMDVIYVGIKLLKENKVCDDVIIVQEEYAKHLHIWLFPWHSWMNDKFKKSIGSLRDICKYALENATKEDIDKVMKVVELLKESN